MGFCATLFLLFYGFVLCSGFPLRQYHYVQLPMNWTSAQSYCREHYADLATFQSTADIRTLNASFLYQRAWLGLRDDPEVSDTWKWSSTGKTSRTGYQPWAKGQPSNGAGENCVRMYPSGKWYDGSCNEKRYFVCYREWGHSFRTYHYITLSRTWSSAWAYCRAQHKNLAVIETQEEISEVISLVPASASGFLIGLYRESWMWSDMSQSSFRNWKTGSADNFIGSRSCVVENPLHKWSYLPCEDKYPFICQEVPRQKTVVRLKIETEADLTDPDVNAQILQQLSAALTGQRAINFTLRWKVQPRKQQTSRLTDPVPPSTCHGPADL